MKQLGYPCRTCKLRKGCSLEFMNTGCDSWELDYNQLGKYQEEKNA